MQLKKRLLTTLLCLLCAVFAFCGIFEINNNKTVRAYNPLPDGTIDNIYNSEDEYFEKENLDLLASKAGFADIYAMILSAQSGTITNSQSFTGTTLKFGEYTFGGNTYEFTWIPVYLSKDNNGNAILTLWLAYNDNKNGTVSNQEWCIWSDGTDSNSAQNYTENGNTYSIYSNTYDGSFIRHYMLYGNTDYAKSWGSGTAVDVSTIPQSTLTKYTAFTGGSLTEYLVTPSDVQWQTDENKWPNDPKYSDATHYPANWLNDTIWLPSATELGFQNVTIWGTTAKEMANETDAWLRSGYGSSVLAASRNGNCNYSERANYAQGMGVRPALHLNLTKASQKMAGPVNPQPVSTTYNGSNQTIDDVAAADKGWYDASKVALSYFSDAACTVAATPKNAGEYYIKVLITDPDTKFKDDAEATALGWKAVKFTITKKKITVTVSDSDGDGVPDTATPNTGQIYAGDPTPDFSFIYSTAPNVGSGTIPTAAGTYYATAKITDTNSNYEIDTSGTSHYAQFIVKGTYDFSDVKWQYQSSSGATDFPASGLTYTGNNITLTVTGLPSGLSILSTNYTGNVAKDAGSYTAKVTAITGVDTAHYNAVDVTAIPQFTFNYKINKVQVPLSWTNKSVSIDGNAVAIPDLPSNAAYSVVYYAENDFDTAAGEPKAGATALTQSELTFNYTSVDTYYAYALLDKNVVYQNNYELTGTKYSPFTIGGGKTAVVVTLNNSSKTYDGTTFEASATPTLSDGSAAGIQLTYSYFASDGTSSIPAPKNAGTYYVKVEVAAINSSDYAISGTSVFEFNIDKADCNLSGLTWNYTSPFVYERDASGAVTHSVAPILPDNLPDDIVKVITGSYSGVYSQTETGTYRATASVSSALQNNADIQNNYNIIYPASFPETCDWKISELNIEMPAYDGSWTIFDGEDKGHDLAAACGLPADWQYYIDLTVNITLPDGTKQTYDGIDGNNFLGYDAGEYELIFTVKSGVNIGADFNVWIGDDDTQTVTISVAPKTVTVADWKGSGTKAQAQFAEDGVLSEWYTYVVYDDSGNKAVLNANGTYPAGNYTRTVEPTSQNLVIEYNANPFVAFTVDEQGNESAPEITPVEKPQYTGSLTYNGTEFEITDDNAEQYFTGWDGERMTVTACDKGTDAGDYTVTVALKDTSFTAWADDESTAPVQISWTISKAMLSGEWGENGKLTLSAEGMSELPEELILYTYTDKDGNPVEKLVAGSDYSVTAALNPDFENNFEFDESLTTLIGEPHVFTQTESGGSGCNGVDPFLFVLIGIALVYIILIILLVHVIIKKRRQREEEEEADFEPDEDDDDEDEEDETEEE